MARLIFPSERLSLRAGSDGQAFTSTAGETFTVWTAETAGSLADILTEGGGAVTGSELTVDDDSLIPLFQGPNDGTDTLWAQPDGGTTRYALYARTDDRIDTVAAGVASVTAGLASEIARAVAAESAVASDLSAHLADTVDAHDASAISYAGGTGMSATDVESAIDELATEKLDTATASATYVPQVATGYGNGLFSARSTMKRGSLPRMVPLITGTDDESGTLSNCSATADTVNYKVGDRGWKITSTASGFMTFALDPIPPITTSTAGVPLPPWQALSAWIYIPDATKVVDITLYAYFDDALTTGNRWGKGSTQFPAQTLVNGWNLIRIPANFGTLPADTTTLYRIAVVVNTNASSTQVTIGHVWLESHNKAKIMIVLDRGYTSWFDYAYAAVKAAGIPVTIAADTTLWGTSVGTSSEVISEAYLDTVAAENGNSVSLHAWDGSVTSTMTAAQLRADQAKGMKWLARKGFAGRMWRAAFTQQNAPQYAAIRNMVIASASGVTADADKWNMWPPADLMRISRRAIDTNGSATTTTIDSQFTFLQAHYGLDVYFFHGIGTASIYDTPAALWDYFLAKVQAGIVAGWLEAVTFEELYYRAGGQFQSLGGASMATYTDQTGTVVTKTII